jgi:hypothetical protein
MSEGLTIYCGPADESGKRLVVATLGGHQHRDKLDVDSQFQRQKFREKVVGKFQLGDDGHEAVEAEILRAADVEDERGTPLMNAKIVSMADVVEKRIDWFWNGYFPAGAIVVLDGDPGEAKTKSQSTWQPAIRAAIQCRHCRRQTEHTTAATR